jgi:hypothetical protein
MRITAFHGLNTSTHMETDRMIDELDLFFTR